MKCPHCKKQINMLNEAKKIRKNIIKILKDKPMKMIDIQKRLHIRTRGSLRHNLNILQKNNLIEPMIRNNKEYGRPTYIKLKQQIK